MKHGLVQLNQETQEWIKGHRDRLPLDIADDDEGPIWNRTYSKRPGFFDCRSLREHVLKILGVQRMVVGHTIQTHINSACNDTVWRIDVALSMAFREDHQGGSIEILEIQGNQVRPITAEEKYFAR